MVKKPVTEPCSRVAWHRPFIRGEQINEFARMTESLKLGSMLETLRRCNYLLSAVTYNYI